MPVTTGQAGFRPQRANVLIQHRFQGELPALRHLRLALQKSYTGANPQIPPVGLTVSNGWPEGLPP